MKNNILPDPALIPAEFVAQKIYFIRGRRVMLDSDLAELYQVPTKVLNQAVRRNKDRFPADFMFQLTLEENAQLMRSQIVTASKRNIRSSPYVFTEHGVAMLSSVLKSKRAIQMNISIIRVFMKMRELLASNKDLAQRLEKLEIDSKRHAQVLLILIRDIKQLTDLPLPEPEESKGQIGFHV